jgi:hypothetical protein
MGSQTFRGGRGDGEVRLPLRCTLQLVGSGDTGSSRSIWDGWRAGGRYCEVKGRQENLIPLPLITLPLIHWRMGKGFLFNTDGPGAVRKLPR